MNPRPRPYTLAADRKLARSLAMIHLRQAYKFSRDHSAFASEALAQWGDHGSPISGCVRDHFPEYVKAALVDLASGVSSRLDRSRELWRLSGARHATWMKAKELVISQDGRGFYG